MGTIQTDFSRTRPRVCAFFAGRVWYAGIDSLNKSGWVLFSQVATHTNRLANCYQANDPTSEVFSDLLDDDGGIIPIPEAGDVLKLAPSGNVLLVFASNGVWSIRGGDNGFKATEYSVEKVTNAAAVSASSIVELEDMFIYWSPTAIYALKMDQAGIGQVQNMTDENIKTKYNSISLQAKQYCAGVYNRTQRIVYFAYCTTDDMLFTHGKFHKNELLKFDLNMKCWYVETLDSTIPYIAALATTKEIHEDTQQFEVIADGGDNVVANGNNVVAMSDITDSATSETKFLTVYSPSANVYRTTFSNYDDTRDDFLDWAATEQSAYVVTGYNFGGVGPVRFKTAPMITVFAKRTEDELDASYLPLHQSSILMQTRWDFTGNTYTGKWSDEYEVYRQLRPYFAAAIGAFDDGYPLVVTRNKVRGRGKAMQIKWQAGTAKDMKIAGWSINFVGNTNV